MSLTCDAFVEVGPHEFSLCRRPNFMLMQHMTAKALHAGDESLDKPLLLVTRL
jgi:hypothetical protein